MALLLTKLVLRVRNGLTPPLYLHDFARTSDVALITAAVNSLEPPSPSQHLRLAVGTA